MKQLTDEEICEIWGSGATFNQLVQSAYERGYQDGVIKEMNGLRNLVSDMQNLDTLEERDAKWYAYQKNRNR
jgi:hypothetical protein